VLGAFVCFVSDEMQRAVEGAEREPKDVAALVHLSKYPGQSVEGLRAPLDLTHSGCVRLVDRLERAGLLRREAGVDARSVALRLTRKGEQAVETALLRRASVLESIISELTPSERSQLGNLVSKVLSGRVLEPGLAYRTCRLCDYEACKACPVAQALEPT
jgi:DNA-binding MarR family transcriptional regulator